MASGADASSANADSTPASELQGLSIQFEDSFSEQKGTESDDGFILLKHHNAVCVLMSAGSNAADFTQVVLKLHLLNPCYTYPLRL